MSPPTIVRQTVCPRSVESPRSPLLNRVQSSDRLSGAQHGDKKAFSQRHTVEVPQGETEELESQMSDIASGFVCVGDHARQGLYLAGQRVRDPKEVVVMRKLNLSERRDSFKKQEAVQEVSFDDTDEKEVMMSTPVPSHPRFKAAWIGVTQTEGITEKNSEHGSTLKEKREKEEGC